MCKVGRYVYANLSDIVASARIPGPQYTQQNSFHCACELVVTDPGDPSVYRGGTQHADMREWDVYKVDIVFDDSDILDGTFKNVAIARLREVYASILHYETDPEVLCKLRCQERFGWQLFCDPEYDYLPVAKISKTKSRVTFINSACAFGWQMRWWERECVETYHPRTSKTNYLYKYIYKSSY